MIDCSDIWEIGKVYKEYINPVKSNYFIVIGSKDKVGFALQVPKNPLEVAINKYEVQKIIRCNESIANLVYLGQLDLGRVTMILASRAYSISPTDENMRIVREIVITNEHPDATDIRIAETLNHFYIPWRNSLGRKVYIRIEKESISTRNYISAILNHRISPIAISVVGELPRWAEDLLIWFTESEVAELIEKYGIVLDKKETQQTPCSFTNCMNGLDSIVCTTETSAQEPEKSNGNNPLDFKNKALNALLTAFNNRLLSNEIRPTKLVVTTDDASFILSCIVTTMLALSKNGVGLWSLNAYEICLVKHLVQELGMNFDEFCEILGEKYSD